MAFFVRDIEPTIAGLLRYQVGKTKCGPGELSAKLVPPRGLAVSFESKPAMCQHRRLTVQKELRRA